MTPNRLLDEEKDWGRDLYCIPIQGGRVLAEGGGGSINETHALR